MFCVCCGSPKMEMKEVLWKELIDGWRLGPHEVDYINRQQGFHCASCGSNLRSMALAKAIMTFLNYSGLFRKFVSSDLAKQLRILEINESGSLNQFLKKLPHHMLKGFPEIDMMNLSFEDGKFDLVVHSDTLEHIQNPIRGLSECGRVLRAGGFCAFTVPMVVDRLTVSRVGLPPAFHGSPRNPGDCMVYTEYGADVWKHLILAGFMENRIFSLEYPAAQAFVGVK